MNMNHCHYCGKDVDETGKCPDPECESNTDPHCCFECHNPINAVDCCVTEGCIQHVPPGMRPEQVRW